MRTVEGDKIFWWRSEYWSKRLAKIIYNSETKTSTYLIVLLSFCLNQKLIRGLKRVARFYAPKYSKLICIFWAPYLVIQNSKWPLCYKTNLSWNITNFIAILEEVLSFYDYYMLCNFPLSFLEHKKYDLVEKNMSTEKENIP